MPTTKRSTGSGTYWTSATPSVPMISASVAAAANAPSRELRQLIVTPTTRTMVNASTNSTAEARKAATNTGHAAERAAHCMKKTPQLLNVSNTRYQLWETSCSYNSTFTSTFAGTSIKTGSDSAHISNPNGFLVYFPLTQAEGF